MDVAATAIDHATLGAAPWGRNGWGVALLMRDVSGELVPVGDDAVPEAQHVGLLDALASLCATTWGWHDELGLLPHRLRWEWFGPSQLAGEAMLGYPERVPEIAVEGWERFAARVPAATVELIDALRADAEPLSTAVRATPQCFIHGDWKFSNLGTAPDGRTVLLDWAYPGEGPACHELVWYLALNRSRLPVGHSKETTIGEFRDALERHGVDTAGWWERQLGLCLLGGLVLFGWEKAWGDDDELQLVVRRRHRRRPLVVMSVTAQGAAFVSDRHERRPAARLHGDRRTLANRPGPHLRPHGGGARRPRPTPVGCRGGGRRGRRHRSRIASGDGRRGRGRDRRRRRLRHARRRLTAAPTGGRRRRHPPAGAHSECRRRAGGVLVQPPRRSGRRFRRGGQGGAAGGSHRRQHLRRRRPPPGEGDRRRGTRRARLVDPGLVRRLAGPGRCVRHAGGVPAGGGRGRARRHGRSGGGAVSRARSGRPGGVAPRDGAPRPVRAPPLRRGPAAGCSTGRPNACGPSHRCGGRSS